MTRAWRRACAVATIVAVGSLGLIAAPANAKVESKTKTKCPRGAIDKAKSKPVEITMWHSMGGARANIDELTGLTDRFNASQSDVHVNLVNQTSYKETFQKFRAGLSSGDLPDLGQFEDTALQQLIDTKAVLPAQACIDAEKYDLSDHLKRVVDYWSVKGTLWPMPFNLSNPVFYYDKAAFRSAGLDPEKPPTTFDEVRSAAEKLKASGVVTKAGMGLKLDAWHLEQWLAKAGDPYVNNGNGRKARATKVEFDNKNGRRIFGFWSGMVRDGLAETNPTEGPSAIDNLIGIGTHSHAMTIDTSAALGTVTQILGTGQYADVEVGVAPMPGPSGNGGILVGGAGLYIVNKSAPEKQEAAWRFAKFLNDPQTQAEWAAATGYIPVRKSAVDLPPIQQRWSQNPGFKVAYDQLTSGVESTASAGPVIGDYQGVRDAVLEAEQGMFTQGTKPATALNQARSNADQAISEYNSRIGA
jgi:sn-glycerol 3-phosphate transport system substrate-binding protein